MEIVQQNGRFTLFSSKFLSIYSILYDYMYDKLFHIFNIANNKTEKKNQKLIHPDAEKI